MKSPTSTGSGVMVPSVDVWFAPKFAQAAPRGLCITTHADAARLLGPFLDPRHASQRLAVALLDVQDQLLAVALLDGRLGSACRALPAHACAPAIVVGAARAWFAHSHGTPRVRMGRRDVSMAERTHALGAAVGVEVVDHLIVGADRYASWREAAIVRSPVPPRRARERGPVAYPLQAGVEHGGLAFTLVGLAMVVSYAFGPRLREHPSALALTDPAWIFEGAPDDVAWVAGLFDSQSRLFAVAPIRSAQDEPCVIAPSAAHKAALALRARSVILAHRHAACWPRPSPQALASIGHAHALGLALDVDVHDALMISGGDQAVSLRTLGDQLGATGSALWR